MKRMKPKHINLLPVSKPDEDPLASTDLSRLNWSGLEACVRELHEGVNVWLSFIHWKQRNTGIMLRLYVYTVSVLTMKSVTVSVLILWHLL